MRRKAGQHECCPYRKRNKPNRDTINCVRTEGKRNKQNRDSMNAVRTEGKRNKQNRDTINCVRTEGKRIQVRMRIDE